MNELELNIDWKKLQDYKTVIRNSIKYSLPSDSNFSDDDINSEIDEHFLNLIRTYKPLNNGMSLESYIWKYAELRAYNSLLDEYDRIKQTLVIDDCDDTDDDGNIKHHISPNCLVDRHRDTYKEVETKIDRSDYHKKMTLAYEVAIKMDKETEGYYDFAYIIDCMKMKMSDREIAEELGTNKMEISRRVQKIRNQLSKYLEKSHTRKSEYKPKKTDITTLKTTWRH